MAGASGDVLAGMLLTRCLQGSAQGRAGMYERGCASGDFRAGTVLTRCLQGSAQCFAEASGDVRAGMYERGCASRDGFDAVFAGFCASTKIK
jgi:hypothetical protein